MRRLAGFTLLIGMIGCAGQSQTGDNTRVPPDDQASANLVDVTASYRRLGRLAAAGALPFVGTVVFAAAPVDSVITVVGLSLENRALAFQREGATFLARYRVSLSLQRDGSPPIEVAREEIVRVANFQETQRTDESVLFQQAIRVTPGTYKLAVTVRDMSSTSESRAERDILVPTFGPGNTSGPILTYQATGRGALADPLSIVLNSRGAIAYGADTLFAYVEGYGFTGPAAVPFEVQDEQQNVIFSDSLRFRGGRPVESLVIRLPPDSMALGEVKLVVGKTNQRTATALVLFSQAWMASSFDEVIDMLRYFGHEDQVRALRRASAAERSKAWRTFYHDTDPNTATPENEALSEYFGRVASANRLFADEGIPGWQTDRGEVYINLGPADEIAESAPGQAARVVRWNYMAHRLTLFFQDETGFGRLRLTAGSRSEYERTLLRVRKQA